VIRSFVTIAWMRHLRVDDGERFEARAHLIRAKKLELVSLPMPLFPVIRQLDHDARRSFADHRRAAG
jgi:hypothetical protein